MIKKTISLSFIIPALACGSDTIVIIPQAPAELPIDDLRYLDVNTAPEEESFYAERIVFEEELPEEEQPAQEEPPVQEEQPVEEEPLAEEEPEEEHPVEEEQPVEEEIEEEQSAEEELVEDTPWTGECELGGGIYNFQSSCSHPFACLSRHVDNFDGAPQTGFCGKMCFGHSNCPGDTQCVLNGVTPGVGYCER